VWGVENAQNFRNEIFSLATSRSKNLILKRSFDFDFDNRNIVFQGFKSFYLNLKIFGKKRERGIITQKEERNVCFEIQLTHA
jgi:hypothetical protein